MKKLRQFFLTTLVLLGSALTSWAQSFTIGYLRYTVTDATNHYVSVVRDGFPTGVLEIPATVVDPGTDETYTVTSIEQRAFSGCYGLTEVTIPETVTSIGQIAFYGCYGLTKITLPFAGDKPHTENDRTQYPFGYIFGTSSYNGSTATPQNYYNGVGVSSSTYYIPTSLKEVVINGSSYISKHAFNNCQGLTSIIIGNSVTSIGDCAFASCTGLTEITIPESVTTIGSSVFNVCNNLTKVTINSTTIASNSYPYSSYLGKVFGSQVTEYVLSDNITSLSRCMFKDCSNLTSITIPNSVTEIGIGAFSGCNGLTEIIIPESVTDIQGEAFMNCYGLTEIIIPESVNSIGDYAFYGCTKVDYIVFERETPPTFKGTNIFNNTNCLICVPTTEAVEAYKSAPNIGVPSRVGLTPIEVDGFKYRLLNDGINAVLVKAMNRADEIVIPESFTYLGETYHISSIETFAFNSWTNLKKVTINNNDVASKTYSSSTNLKTIFGTKVEEYVFGESVTTIGDYALYDGSSALKSVSISESVTSIGKYAFVNCSGLESINIPNSVTSFGSSPFYNCSSLASITTDCEVIGNAYLDITIDNILYRVLDKKSVAVYPKKYENSYSGEIVIPGTITAGNTFNVTSIGSGTFRSCGDLTAITIPNSVISIGGSAFYNCSGLTSVTIPNSVTSIGGSAFYGCTGLTEITIPESVTSIGGNAFFDCNSLTSITTDCEVIGDANLDFIKDGIQYRVLSKNSVAVRSYFISGTNSYSGDVVIPSAVSFGNTFAVSSIYGRAFENCSGLTSVTIPNSVTSIGNNAFENCSGLTSITIPNSVTSIDNSAFYGCNGLTSITTDCEVISSDNNLYFTKDGMKYRLKNKNDVEIVANSYSGIIVISETVTAGSTFKVAAIGYQAFKGCDLQEIVFESETPPSLSYLYDAPNCPIYVPSLAALIAYRNAASSISNRIQCRPVIVDGVKYQLKTNGTLEVVANNYSGDVVIRGSVEFNGVETAVTSIDYYAFQDCSSLTSVDFLGADQLTYIGSFKNCTNLTSITIPSGVEKLDVSIVTQNPLRYETATFKGCTNLTKVTINSNAIVSKDYDTYNNIKVMLGGQVKEIVLGENVTKIGKYAFYNWFGTSITIPNSVTSIGEYALYGCTSLPSLTIPASVRSIGRNAFYNISKIVFEGATPPSMGYDALYHSAAYTNYEDYPVYVPTEEAVTAYKNAITGVYESSIAQTKPRIQVNPVCTITATANKSNYGTVSGSGTYTVATTPTITISATPAEHCRFVEWSDGETDATREISIPAELTRYTAIFNRVLTISNVAADNKVYDDANTATITFESDELADDDVRVNYTATFDNVNVGASKTVTYNFTLKGYDADNYVFAEGSQSGTVSANITARELTLSNFEADSKTYDATTNATGGQFSDNRLSGDELEFSYNYAFTDKNVGTNKEVNFSSIAISGGADKDNYTLVTTSGKATADIGIKTLTISNIAAANKVYDGNDATTVSYTTDKFAGDDVTFGDAATFTEGKTVGNNKTVSFNYTKSGSDAANYAFAKVSDETTANIEQRQLEFSSITAEGKEYDGNTTTTVAIVASNIVNGDVVTFGTAAAFDNKNVGTDKTVNFDFTKSGADAANYKFASETGTAKANITARSLTLSNFKADSKTYDATTNATGGQFSDNRLSGDELEFSYDYAFTDKNVGTNKDVNFSSIAISGGADKNNYTLATTSGKATADITVKTLNISNIKAESKTYDGNTETSVSYTTDKVASDDVTFGTTATFADKNVENGKAVSFNYTKSGADAANYAFANESGSTTANIEPRELAISSVSAASKEYDGNTATTVTIAASNIVSGDVVTFGTAAAFADKNVGTNKTVNFTYTKSGADAANYSFAQANGTATAAISARELTLSNFVVADKVYDGTVDGSGSFSDDRVSGDVLEFSYTVEFDDENANTDIDVYFSDIEISGGADKDNYYLDVDESEPKANADITPVTDEVVVTIAMPTRTVVYSGHEGRYAMPEMPDVFSWNTNLYNLSAVAPADMAEYQATLQNIQQKTDVGEYPLGWNNETFVNVSSNFTNVSFSVTDGKLIITPNTNVVVTITENSNELVYNTEEQKVEGYSVDIEDETGTFAETDIAFSGNAVVAGTTVGSYAMELSAADFSNTNANFAEVTFNIVDGALTITKAPEAPNKPEAEMETRYINTQLVALPADWAWSENKALEMGTNTATANYTGADKGNYETESVEITITRLECLHNEGNDILYTLDPTCTHKGYTGNTSCKLCGQIYEMGDSIPALGHDFVNTVIAPTCTTDGYTEHLCSRCQHLEYSDTIAATGHKADSVEFENVVAATCTAAGSRDSVVYCSVCQIELSREEVVIPATGHEAGAAVAENLKAATCTEAGSVDSVVYCTVCKEELSRKTVVIDATGHKAGAAVAENLKAATCTEAGSVDSVVYCTACKEELSRKTVVIEPTGHKAGAAVAENLKEATCTAAGSVDSVVYCTVCKAELSRKTVEISVIPHTAGAAVAENLKEATCTEAGSVDSVVYCTVCKAELSRKTVELPATGHTEVVDAAVAATCTESGLTEGSHCSVCNAIIKAQEVIPATGHKADSIVIENVVAATYTAAGSYDSVVYCSVCKVELSRTTIEVPQLVAPKVDAEVVISQIEYTVGDSLKLDGGKLVITTSDSTTAEVVITPDMIKGFNPDSVGVQQVTVEFTVNNVVYTTTFEVEVKEAVVIEVVAKSLVLSAPAKVIYKKGEALDVAGGKLTVTYSDGTTQDVDLKADMVSGFDAEKIGAQQLTVTLKIGEVVLTATFDVTVEADDNTAISDDEAAAVNIYAYQNVIVVENADADILVFDAMGRMISRTIVTTDRTVLQVERAGVYVVKTGSTAKRVMIND